MLETYKNNFKMGVNILMIEVSQFKIIKKNNIYYLKLTNTNGDERIISIWYIWKERRLLHLIKV